MSSNRKPPVSASRRTFVKTLAMTPLVGVLPSGLARAEASYPTRPVRFILPFGAGGVADVTSRLVMERLSAKLGQRFVVENVPGPGGIAAARAALSGGTDGHSLVLMTNGTAISAALFKKLPFDPVKDFVPVTSIGTFECVFVVNASSPYRTLDDLLKAMRAQPGKFNVGTIAVGSTQHLTAELFRSMAKVDFTHVPSKTSGDAVVSLLRDDVHLVVEFYAALRANLADGKIRALAWSGTESSPAMPEVPPAAKAVPGFDVVSWNAMYAPAGTPKDVIGTLNAALREVLAEAPLRKRALEMGIVLNASTPDEIQQRLLSDIKKWSDVIDNAKIARR